MKKLLISLGMALGILASTATSAQTAEPFLLPAFAYSVQNVSGTFTDISDNPQTVKLGTELAAGTDLKNITFVGTRKEGLTNTYKLNASNGSALTDTCLPLGFEFKFSGKPMKYFVVSAFGGAYFSDTLLRYPTTTQPTMGLASTNCAFIIPYIAKTTSSSAPTIPVANQVTVKEGVAPACYLIEGTDGQHILTVQHHYLVLGDEWTFQFKFYEATGNIEFIIKDLQYANAITPKNGTEAFYRMVLSLTESCQFPSGVDDPYGTKAMNITPLISGTTHKLFIGQTDAASAAKGWDTITIASAATNNMRIDANHHPEEGRTIRFVYPNACPEHATQYTAEHYNITDQTATENSFSANIHFKQAMFQSLERIANSGTIVAILSKDETPQYTLANGTWYKKGDNLSVPATEGAFVETVLCNAQPKFTASAKAEYGYNMGKAIALSATGLEKAMQYYIHIYNMKYDCDGAPVYSELCHTLPFTTSFDMPKKLEAGLPTVNSVALNVEPAEGLSVLLVKSKTPDCKPSGTLSKGDKIGDDAEVLDILTEAGTLPLTLAENEGVYILAFTANTSDPTHHVYAPNAISISVRAAYPTLPGVIDFAGEPYTMPDLNNPSWEQLSKTTFRPLPFGWTRETEILTEQRNKAFGTGKPNYDKTIRTYLYAEANNGQEFDIITPVFVCDKERVLATFNMTQLRSQDETATVMSKPDDKDTIVIEYAIEDGEWTRGALFTGAELPETNPEGYYPLECKIEDEGIQGKRMRLRYRYAGAGENIFNALPSIEIKEAKICDKPHSIVQLDSLTTDRQAVIRWTDDNYPAATAFKVFYKLTGDETDNWESLSSKTPDATIDHLAPNASYIVYITANCGRDGDSYDSYPSTFSTLRDFPYADSLKQAPNYTVIINGTPVSRKGDGPFKRGWTTATGTLAAAEEDQDAPAAKLTFVEPTDPTAFMPDASYAALSANGIPTSVGIREAAKNAWLLAPVVYIEAYGQNYPLHISFKANSAQQVETEGVKTWVKGTIPDRYTDAVLYVLVSSTGQFSMNDTIASIPISGKTIADQTYSFDVPGIEGQAQVAFYVRNPKGSDADDAPMMLFEIYDVAFSYVGTPCFPLTDLKRSNTTTEQATFSWKGNSAEYKIYWGTVTSAIYSDSAQTAETTYTLTGLQDFTQYNVKIIGYCNEEHTQTAPTELTAKFMTLQACHTPLNFEVTEITATGATFISTSDQPDFMSQRLVYVTPKTDAENTLIFPQLTDTLAVTGKLTKTTTYIAKTQAICGTDSSEMSEPKEFTTLAPATYAVALNITPENAGTVTGNKRYEAGAQVTITATAAETYDFVAWMDGETELSKEAAYTFTMPAKDVTYTAVFKEKPVIGGEYLLTLNVTPENAGTVKGAGRYKEGVDVTISATAADNYEFIAWMDANDTLSKAASYTFKMPAEALTYTALFVEKQANEDMLKAAFNVMTKNGQLHIHNCKGLTIEEVAVYGLTGKLINRFPLNSREDLALPIDAQNALLLVRIATEQGITVYKVYLH